LFSRQISGDGKIQYIGFSFTAQAYYPDAGVRYEYQYSTDFQGGAELRMNPHTN
jgi:hypothetical protein